MMPLTIVKWSRGEDTRLIMRAATLVSWLVTASLGAFMLRTWLARGGLRSERAKAGGLPPQLIFGHAAAAITGLLVWVAFVASGARPLAWAAVVLLMAAVGLGLCTVTLWTPYPARKPGERREPAAPPPADDRAAGHQEFEVTDEMIARLLADPVPAPGHRPIRPNPAVLVPIAHGFAAIATFTLAVLSAIV
jgi:manganese efflux pump family protein